MQFHGELLRSEKALEVAFAGGGWGGGAGVGGDLEEEGTLREKKMCPSENKVI